MTNANKNANTTKRGNKGVLVLHATIGLLTNIDINYVENKNMFSAEESGTSCPLITVQDLALSCQPLATQNSTPEPLYSCVLQREMFSGSTTYILRALATAKSFVVLAQCSRSRE